MNRRLPSGLVGLLGVLVGGVLMFQTLAAADGNPTVFLRIGEATPEVEALAEGYFESVVLLPQLGHDGRFFFVQATDPWIGHPDEYRRLLDFPAYRARRVAFPLLAGGFGILPGGLIPWGMAVVNVAALGIGAWGTARLAEGLGLSPLFGFAFLANPGMFNEFFVSGAGILALAGGVWGIVAVSEGRWGLAAAAFVGAVLAREVMMLTVAGVVVWLWAHNRRRAVWVAAAPVLALVGWSAWVWIRLGPDVGGSRSVLAWPFVGLARALGGWLSGSTGDLVMGLVMIAAAALVARCAFTRPGPLSWGTVGFALMAPLLSRVVWQRAFDISRALAPLFTAAVLLVAAARAGAPQPGSGLRSTQGRHLGAEDMS